MPAGMVISGTESANSFYGKHIQKFLFMENILLKELQM